MTRTARIPRISIRAGISRYRNDRLGLLQDLASQQTPIVESVLGPVRLVIVTDAELNRELLVQNADKLSKGPAISRYARPVLGQGMLSAEGIAHRKRRKMLSPKFQPRHVARYALPMVEQTQSMLQRWRDGKASNDFAAEMTELTMAIAAQTMFGTKVDHVVEVVTDALDACNHYIIEEAVSLVHLPLSVPTKRNRTITRALAALDAVIYAMIEEHRANKVEQDDVLSVLLAARDEDDQSALTDEMIRDEVVTFFLAGHETTANALAWAYPLLCDNPQAVKRARVEVDAVLQGRAPTFDDFSALPYTANVFKEVLRLYPPSYMVGRQAQAPFLLGEYQIRKGTYVLANSYGSQRRADYFPNPEAFVPERFEEEGAWPRLAFLAFGAGPRVCIGAHFAMLEGALILAMLFQHLEFSDTGFAYDAEPLITLRPRHGVPFSLRWRE